MPRDRKRHGYARQRELPDIPGSSPRVCKHCDKWFAARPRETVCDGCVPNATRAKRAALGNHLREPSSVGKRAGQQGVYSEVLGLVFLPGVPVWRQLAIEAAAGQRWSTK